MNRGLSRFLPLTRTLGWLVVGLALGLSLFSCDQDPFGLSTRHVAGDYYLRQWEDGTTYYLDEAGREKDVGGGLLGGTIEKIGWNSRYIIAKRDALFRGDPDGWMVVDVTRKTVQGPLPKEQVDRLAKQQGIHRYSAADAWRRLK